jgi:cell division protein FtsN
MPSDYKYTTRRRRRQGPTGWAWLLAGSSIGLFVAFLVYLHSTSDSGQETDFAVAIPIPTELAGREAPKAAVAGVPQPSKPRFDFYTLLPEMEVVVPKPEISGQPQPGVREVEKAGTYLLQAGSFRELKKADELKARLALLGFEASIQTVKINNRETWHRVRAGPFSNLGELNVARARLKGNNISAILLKRQ